MGIILYSPLVEGPVPTRANAGKSTVVPLKFIQRIAAYHKKNNVRSGEQYSTVDACIIMH